MKWSYFISLYSGTKDTSICNYQQHGKCLTYAHRAFSFIYKLKADCDSESLGERSLCACYPLCNEVRYDASSVLNDYQMLEPELDGKYSLWVRVKMQLQTVWFLI
jgi:hypothetical protein